MIKELQSQVNTFLNQQIDAECAEPTLQSATRYSLMAGGKRLRPALTLAVCQACGQRITPDVLKAACAVELLHTYSLIHDDLPAMDDDDLRRGLPTNHRRFGAGMATLAGDGLLTLAFQWVSDNGLDPQIRLALVQELSRAAGPLGMVAGQAMDIHNEGHRLSFTQLKQLHEKKTGALLRYSTLAGGLIAGQNSNVLLQLSHFGAVFGLAFQIHDDLMDVVGTEEQMGKAVHKDQGEHKNTYPGLLGVDQTRQELRKAVSSAHQIVDKLADQTHRDFSVLNEFLAYFE